MDVYIMYTGILHIALFLQPPHCFTAVNKAAVSNALRARDVGQLVRASVYSYTVQSVDAVVISRPIKI